MDIRELEIATWNYLFSKGRLNTKLKLNACHEIYRIYIREGFDPEFVVETHDLGTIVFRLEAGRTVINWKHGITGVEAYLLLAKLFNNQNNTI